MTKDHCAPFTCCWNENIYRWKGYQLHKSNICKSHIDMASHSHKHDIFISELNKLHEKDYIWCGLGFGFIKYSDIALFDYQKKY